MRVYAPSICLAVFLVSCFVLSVTCFNLEAGKPITLPSLSRHKGSKLWYQKQQANDDNRLYVPPKYVMDVIKKRRDQQITVADVSAVSGAGLAEVQKDLMQLAHVSGGRMQVTTQGEIIYVFPSNFEYTILRHSVGRRVQLAYEKVAPTLGFVFRACFGVCLVASLAVIMTALMVAMASQNASSGGKGDGDRKKGQGTSQHHDYRGSSFVAYIDLTDVLRLILRYAKWPDKGSTSNGNYNAHYGSSYSLGLSESFFSFVFGDGNPNQDFEEKASAQAAQMIRYNNGVVTAEQLAPYLRTPPPPLPPLSQPAHDESFVLPLLLRFNGQPRVTTNGHIYYTFPELLSSGQSTYRLEVTPLWEEPVPFSRADSDMQFLAGVLAGANLLGAVALARVVHSSASWVRKLYPALLFYAVMLTVVPLHRYLTSRTENNKIYSRNNCRQNWLDLAEKDQKFLKKLQDVTQFSNQTDFSCIDQENRIVFDTTLTNDF